MSWDGNERRRDNVSEEIKDIKRTIEHHIGSDDTKFSLMVDKLHDLDNSVAKLIILNTETLKSQMSLLSENQKLLLEHNKFLYDPKDGISIQIDRLNGAEESRKWTFRVMWASIIGILTKIFYDLIKR